MDVEILETLLAARVYGASVGPGRLAWQVASDGAAGPSRLQVAMDRTVAGWEIRVSVRVDGLVVWQGMASEAAQRLWAKVQAADYDARQAAAGEAEAAVLAALQRLEPAGGGHALARDGRKTDRKE